VGEVWRGECWCVIVEGNERPPTYSLHPTPYCSITLTMHCNSITTAAEVYIPTRYGRRPFHCPHDFHSTPCNIQGRACHTSTLPTTPTTHSPLQPTYTLPPLDMTPSRWLCTFRAVPAELTPHPLPSFSSIPYMTLPSLFRNEPGVGSGEWSGVSVWNGVVG